LFDAGFKTAERVHHGVVMFELESVTFFPRLDGFGDVTGGPEGDGDEADESEDIGE
jgi:hypothetical protein